MENRETILLIGSNAIDNQILSNGAGFIQSIAKPDPAIYGNVVTEPFLADFDMSMWLNDTNSITTNVNKFNVNNTEYFDAAAELENTYSLDDILDDKNVALLSPASSGISSINTIDTPLASPLSDSLDFELDEFLTNAAIVPSNILNEGQVYDQVNENNGFNVFENNLLMTNDVLQMNPESPESGFASSDEMNIDDNSDFFLQLLNDSGMNNTVNINEEENQIIPNIIPDDFVETNNISNDILVSQLLSYNESSSFEQQSPSNSEASSIEETELEVESSNKRHQPYKRKPKTAEQKVRKKAQNRNAAIRYRCKKKGELQIMLEEEEKLQGRNKELNDKVGGLRKEVDYLKNLMLDVIKARLAKGQTNNTSALEMLLQSTSSSTLLS